MPSPLTVRAPVSGTVTVIGDVPDPVFAQMMVGPGVALAPVSGGYDVAVAPIEGTVAVLYPHAFVVQEDGSAGRAVLVHLGLDTVELDGEGFTVHAAQGDRVRAGEPLITWNPRDVERGGRCAICPVVALEAATDTVRVVADVGTVVGAGDSLLVWG